MPVFICRWQNGDFSAASACSREEAVGLLAEVGNAESCEVFKVDNFMVHFHIKDEADDFEEMLPVKFGGFGEQTHRMLRERVYPAYCGAISEIDKDRPNVDDVPKEKLKAAWKLLNDSLTAERTRQCMAKSPELGATLRDHGFQQARHDVLKILTEQPVKEEGPHGI
jgi:hypothetical protein